jgi:membrane associated rhomboid family serine protease
MSDAHNLPMPPPDRRIPGRSRRHAMDWSLALASQGIEVVIENDPETGWALVVPAPDYDRAVATIRQYRLENLHWPWRKPIFKAGLLFDWVSVAWVLVMVNFHWVSTARPHWRSVGIMDNAAVGHGEWWRLFTAILLHADLAHLALNAVFGFVLLGLAMGRYGTGVGLLAAYLAGAGGNLSSWFVHDGTQRGLGASGMVMGALGLLAAQSLSLRRELPSATKYIAGGLAAGVMLFVLLGLRPGTDVMAHFGGFVSGVALGAMLSPVPHLAQRPLTNLFAGLWFAALVVGTWALALKS